MVWFYHETLKKVAQIDNTLSIPLWSDFIFISSLDTSVIAWYASFQSHYGLILSVEIYRKKKERKHLSIPLWSDFIIINELFKKIKLLTFQSHYGLILSLTVDNIVSTVFCTFNPTMVWFYQSLLYSLDHSIMHLSIPLWSDFIKPCKVPWNNKPLSFQSHYGLILSLLWFLVFFELVILSIPLWSDFIFVGGFCIWNQISFQSHYGLILSLCTLYHYPPLKTLSIPLWSDFIWARIS